MRCLCREKAKGLTQACNGAPPRQMHKGGMEGQLRKLRNGSHPKTGVTLPKAIQIEAIEDGITSSRSSGDGQDAPPEGFYRYVATESPVVAPSNSEVSAKRRGDLINRLYSKFAAVKAASANMRVRRHDPACSWKYRIPCLLYTSPSPRDPTSSRMPSSA